MILTQKTKITATAALDAAGIKYSIKRLENEEYFLLLTREIALILRDAGVITDPGREGQNLM